MGLTPQAMFREMKALNDKVEESSRDQLAVFAADINAQRHEPAQDTLENDPISDMNILLRSLQAMFDELAASNREMLSLMFTSNEIAALNREMLISLHRGTSVDR